MTNCKWDSVIPLDEMWKHLKRVIKPKAAMVFTASQPFTSKLVSSNVKAFKHSWVWEKNGGTNFLGVKYAPMKEHEDVLVFCNGTPTYNPIKEQRQGYSEKRAKEAEYQFIRKIQGNKIRPAGVYNELKQKEAVVTYSPLRCPRSIQKFNREVGLHPTQKPVALMEYMIRTYSNEGETVLDFTMGSGTTGVACMNTNRKFVGIELDSKYLTTAQERIKRSLAYNA
jgi:site-specific DNA-methyltransferase (adenine-specific)